ncbi:MAG: immunoglobulin domain-containing protein [Verrucomicrobia bacterium]|nr:immunoglobulin domain-containing protein [Verrucomicrobiota bacterium]
MNSRHRYLLLSSFLPTLFGITLYAQVLTFHPDSPPTSAIPPTQRYHHYTGVDAHQKGPKTLLFVYIRPVDGQTPNVKSMAQFNAEMDNLSQAYYNASFKQTWFGPKRRNGFDVDRLVVTEVLDLPETVAYYRGNFWMLMNHTYAAVRAQGGEWNGGAKDPARFDRVMAFGNPKLISSTGMAYVGAAFSWSGDRLDAGVAIHELGHNWGVYHANFWIGDNGIPRNASGTHVEYGDGGDTMGGGSTLFNAQMKDQLNFLERGRDEMRTVTSSGTYRLFAHTNRESRRPETNTRGLHLPVDGMNRWNRSHILGFRFTDAPDGLHTRASWDRNAVQVHATGFGRNGSHLLDTTPNSRLDDDRIDSAIKIGRTFSEGPNVNGTHMYGGVHITALARGSETHGGVDHEYIDVVVNYQNDINNNQPPTASFPQTLLTGVDPGVPYTLTVTAGDPDGDALAFDWDFGNNTYNLVSSPTQTVTWNTPGVYLVSVTVSDMKGGLAMAQMWVNVGDVPFRSPENPAQTVSGLSYTYYEGVYNQLPEWGSQLPVKQGAVDTFSVAPRDRDSNYGLVYEGYLEVPANDVYTFTLRSRDGSSLYIGDTRVVNNDGLQSQASPASGNIPLNAGRHRIRVEMFNRDGNGLLNVEWSTLSSPSALIPASALSRTDPASVTPPAVSITYPTTGMLAIVGSNLEISADASSPNGIDRVVFFIGSAYLGEDSSMPYTFNWSNLPVGSFFLSAVAYDTLGNLTVSETALLDVTSPIQRDSIGINFLGTYGSNGSLAASDQAGAFFMQANWNNAPQGTLGQTWDHTVNHLKDRDGATTAAWTRYRSRTHQNHSPDGSMLVNPDTANGRLMYGGLRVRDDTAGPVVDVKDIPFANYDVYVYFDHHEGGAEDTLPNEYVLTPDGQNPLPSIWGHNSLVRGDGVGDYPNYDTWVGFKESTATSASAPVAERLGNYLIFRDISASGFRLTANNPGSAINAVQIVSTAQNPTVPMIYVQPQSRSLPATRTVEFSVQYVGFPEPAVAWYKSGSGEVLSTADTLVLEDIGPADAGDYYAVVTNSEGSDTSVFAALIVTDPPAAAPTGLAASAVSTSEIGLTWTDNATDEDGYLIYRAASPGGPWSLIHTTEADVTEYVDSNLPETTTFYYYVSALNDKGESNPSNIASETTLTSPEDVAITLHPVTTGAIVGQPVSLTVAATGYPAPDVQWRKDGEDIPGANAATFTIESASLADNGAYTARVSNMQSEAVSNPALIVVTEPVPFAINPLYVIHGGAVSENSGTFTMTRSGSDVFQGVVSNFQEVPLLEVGDYIELSFSLRSNTDNNAGRAISFGFFHGPNVTENAQTAVTDLWQGYVHQPGSRSDNGSRPYSLARQGAGPAGLMAFADGAENLNGANHAHNMSCFNQNALTAVTLRLERTSSTQIRLRTVYNTPDSNRNGSGNDNGIAWNFSTVSGVATVSSTFTVADGPEAFNGFAIATRGNWVLNNLSIATNVQLEALPDLPGVTILSPANGSAHLVGEPVLLTAEASDPEDGDISSQVVWTSSIDGALGTGASLSLSTLSLGTHTLTASAQGSGGVTATSSVSITIQEPPPPVRTYLLNFGDTVYTTDGTRQWQSFRLQQTLGTASPKLEHSNVLLSDTEDGNDAGIHVSLTSNVTTNMGRQTGSQVLESHFAANPFDWFTPSEAAQRETGSFDEPGAYWDYTFTGLDPEADVTFQMVIRRTGENRNINLVLHPGESNETSLLSNADTGQTQYVNHTTSGSDTYTLRLSSAAEDGNWVAVVNAMALIVEEMDEPTPAHTVTFTAGNGGSLSGDLHQNISQGDATTEVTATPDEDYAFVNWTWTGGGSSTENPLSIAYVTEDLTVTAHFEAAPPLSDDPAQPENPGGGTGDTYYLDAVNGNDSNSGLSEAQAWQTFQHAIHTLQPGDTVLIREGDYHSEGNDEYKNWDITTSGTPGQYITYRAYPGERPRFHVDTWNGIQLWNVSYIEIDGLEVIGLPDPEWLADEPENSQARKDLAEDRHFFGGGITVTHNGTEPHHIRIRNNLVHRVGGNGIGFRGGNMILVEGNTVHSSTHRSDAGNSAISFVELNSNIHPSNGYGVVVRNNILHNNRNMVAFKWVGYITDGNGVIIDYCQNYTEDRILIANNLAYHNGGRAFHVYNGRNVDILHNTAYHNLASTDLQWSGELSSDAPGGETNESINFHNNIAIARADRRAYNIANTANWHFTRNIANSPHAPAHGVDADNLPNTDPQFVNAANLDFTLQSSSPAIDHGLVFAAVPADALGTERQGSGPDLGAFEFVNVEGPLDPFVLVRYTFEHVSDIGTQHGDGTFVRQATAEAVAPEITASDFLIRHHDESPARLIATDGAHNIAGAAQIAGIESPLFQWEAGGSGNPYFEFTLEGAQSLDTLRIVARSGSQWNNAGAFIAHAANRQAEISVRSSLDNYSANIGAVFVAGNADAFAEQLIDLNNLNPDEQAVTFRIYTRSPNTTDPWHRTQVDLVEVLGTITSPPQDPYAVWASANEISGGATDETDGVPNLLRYALGGTADTPAEAFRLVPQISDNGMSLSITRIEDPRLTYEVWATENLLDWGEAPAWSGEGGGPVVVEIEPLANQLFLHLRVWRE